MDNKNTSEKHPHFPSGEWEGFYLQYGSKYKMACNLDFKDGKVSGAGSDRVGPFRWDGSYNTEIGTCNMTKSYFGKHTVSYSGYADENGIWGKWMAFFGSEGFHIWPKDSGIGDEIEEEIVEEVSNVTG